MKSTGSNKGLARGVRTGAALVLSASLAISGVPAVAFAAGSEDAKAASSDSKDLQLNYTSDGVSDNIKYENVGGQLTIAGTGAIEFTGESAPWLEGRDEGYGSGYAPTAAIREVIIEEGITSIPANAFVNCPNLQKVTLPSTLQSIGRGVFRDCTNLTEIVIPDSVSSLGSGVFYGASKLANVTMPSNITAIPSSAFYECEALQSIEIPAGVEKIGDRAFSGCTKLDGVTFPEGLKEIEPNAFLRNTSLTAIEFPASLEKIGYSAFQNCTSLATVEFNGSPEIGSSSFTNTPYLNNMGDFSIVAGKLLSYNGTDAAEVVVPNTVTEIDASAFGRYSNRHPEIVKVTIPASVTKIGAFVFDYCSNLKTVIMEGTEAPTLGYGAFDGASDDLEIVIPEGSTGYGDTGDPNNFWSAYASKTGTEAELAQRRADREAAAVEAAAITEAISSLPAVIDITAGDKNTIESLVARFGALNDEGKALVPVASQDRLNNANTQLQRILNAPTTGGVEINEENFPDAAFRNILLRHYDGDRNARLIGSELAITSLDLSDGWQAPGSYENLAIQDLAGVAHFTNLSSLDVSNNALSSIDLSSLGNLTELNVSNNNLTELDLAGLEWLETIEADNNRLSSIDLVNKESLSTLSVSGNRIRSIDFSKTPYLSSIDVSNNRIMSLDVAPIRVLSYLNVSDNRLSSLDVSSAGRITTLYASNNRLDKIDLGDSSSLSTVYLDENNLSALDVTGLSGLMSLRARYNVLTSLDVSQNASLMELLVSNNALVFLDLSNNGNLNTLAVSKMQRDVQYSDDSLTLSSLDSNASASKVSEVEGALYENGVFSKFESGAVDFVYDCGNGRSMNVTLYVSKKAIADNKDGSNQNKGNNKIVDTVVKPIDAAVNRVNGVKARNSAKKTVTVSWKKLSGADGYQVARSTKKSKGFKAVKSLSKSKKSWKNKKLKKGKTYYFKVRAYKTVNGKKVYGSYSKTVKVKIKK